MSTRKELRESIARKANKRPKQIKTRAMEPKEPTMKEEFVVVARNPAEMEVAQQKLCVWARNQMDVSTGELKEAEEALTEAKEAGFKTVGFQTVVRHARERLKYYTKVKAALEAGYVIVPNFDLDIFAIRTGKAEPKNEESTSTWGKPLPRHFANETDRPELGEGTNRDPHPELIHTTKRIEDENGKYKRTDHVASTKDWRDVDFPYKLVKPEVISETSRALAQKIFDQVGITPHRRVRNVDPMIVGQVRCKGRPGQDHTLSFLISWWVDHTDLEV